MREPSRGKPRGVEPREAEPREAEPREAEPTFGTSVGGQADVRNLVNFGQARDVHIDARTAPQALFQLPPDIPDFVGREELLPELEAHLRRTSTVASSVGARLALSGPPGVGKSALAIHLAHAVKNAFPYAQLYVNLGAGAGKPLAPAQVLAGFLRALGIEGPYPESVDERAVFYRSQLVGKQTLGCTGHAREITHIQPLLPGSPTCGVIVTSRRTLGGLEGA